MKTLHLKVIIAGVSTGSNMFQTCNSVFYSFHSIKFSAQFSAWMIQFIYSKDWDRVWGHKETEKLRNRVKCSTVFKRRETYGLWKIKKSENGWLKNPYEILFYVDHKWYVYLSTKVNLCREMFYQAVHKFWMKKGVNKKKNLVTWIENERDGVVYIERRDQLCTFLPYPWKAKGEIQRIMTLENVTYSQLQEVANCKKMYPTFC